MKKGEAQEQVRSAVDTIDVPRNFSLPMEERVRALTIGVPAWSARKRRIEDRERELVTALVDFHDGLVDRGEAPDVAREKMRARAEALELTRLTRLVESHNRYYPIEANLGIDPATGRYRAGGRLWQPEPLPTVAAFVARAEAILASRTALP